MIVELRFILSLILPLMLFNSCEQNGGSPSDVPSDMTMEFTIAEDGSGVMQVNAKANNAIEYHLYTGDQISTDPVVNTTGDFTYTYTVTGIYPMQVRAYGSSGKYISKEAQVTVTVGDGGPITGEDGYITPVSYPGMTLIWQDEFNTNTLNEANWTFELGGGGWGNNELQYYRKENTSLSDGFLKIEAKKETFNDYSYTSSRIVTKDKISFKYGRVDIRAVLPQGQGMWPALWMLGTNLNTVGWPSCGEIDIMELVGGGTNDSVVHGTAHWSNGGQASSGDSYSLSSGKFSDEFHVFTLIWDNSSLTWYVDDTPYFTLDITPAELAAFQKNFFFIFNVAVGGNWPGAPNATTIFPQSMLVDYVRVFQKN